MIKNWISSIVWNMVRNYIEDIGRLHGKTLDLSHSIAAIEMRLGKAEAMLAEHDNLHAGLKVVKAANAKYIAAKKQSDATIEQPDHFNSRCVVPAGLGKGYGDEIPLGVEQAARKLGITGDALRLRILNKKVRCEQVVKGGPIIIRPSHLHVRINSGQIKAPARTAGPAAYNDATWVHPKFACDLFGLDGYKKQKTKSHTWHYVDSLYRKANGGKSIPTHTIDKLLRLVRIGDVKAIAEFERAQQ
jgi:hypothetical protein